MEIMWIQELRYFINIKAGIRRWIKIRGYGYSEDLMKITTIDLKRRQPLPPWEI